MSKKGIILLLLIITLHALLCLPYLTTYPPINNTGDESWRMNVAMELLKSGRPVASMFVDTPIGKDVQITTPWIYNGLLSLFFYLFGISIWSGRFLSFICGILVILITYKFGKEIDDSKVGLLSSLLLVSSIIFSWHSREMRQEMMLMIFITLGIYLFYMAWKRESPRFLFLSGFVMAISVEVHPNSVIFAISLLIIYLIFYRRHILSRTSIIFLSGLFVSFIIWIFANYLPFSAASFATVHKEYLPPIITFDLYTLFKKALFNTAFTFKMKFLRWLAFKYNSSFLAGLAYLCISMILVALIFGRKRKELGLLLLFIVFPLFIKEFTTGSWNWFHNSVFLPICVLMTGVSISSLSELSSGRGNKGAIIVVLTMMVVIPGVWDIVKNNIHMQRYDYDALMSKVSSHIPDGSTVLGAAIYYPAFINRDVRFIGYLFLQNRCPDFTEEMQRLDVDYIIMDATFKNIARLWCSNRYYQNQILNFLQSDATLKDIIRADYPSRLIHLQYVYLFKVNKP